MASPQLEPPGAEVDRLRELCLDYLRVCRSGDIGPPHVQGAEQDILQPSSDDDGASMTLKTDRDGQAELDRLIADKALVQSLDEPDDRSVDTES